MFPGADGEEQSRPAKRLPSLAILPIGLADDAHPKAIGFEQPAQQGHGETRMVDIRVAGDEYDVDLIPAACQGFGLRHRQRRRGDGPRLGRLIGGAQNRQRERQAG